ncbi:MAG: ATP-binding protein [Polyangiales bacterium]
MTRTRRFFNTAGPCRPELHYMLPPDPRVPAVRGLVERQSYFVLHAPRQVGKTTALLSLARDLTREGRYAAVLVSAEAGAPFGDDIGAAEDAVLTAWEESAALELPAELRPPPRPAAPPGARVRAMLTAWAVACPRPLVVFVDEIDALRDAALLSVLRQLRDGHKHRPGGFPWALALVGLRDVRDYKVASGGSSHLRTASPFNIKSDSLTMREFTEPEVAELYAQHTADTGQRFEPGALARVYALTRGQPWLVNALGRQLVEDVVPDPSRVVTEADVDRAKERSSRATTRTSTASRSGCGTRAFARSSRPCSRVRRSETSPTTTGSSWSTSGSCAAARRAGSRSPTRSTARCSHAPSRGARKIASRRSAPRG